MAFLPFFTGIRGLCQGMVIRAHRTELVSLATLIRMGSLVVILLLAGGHVPGAQLGALGLLGCIAVESLMMLWFACKCGIMPTGSPEHGVRDTFRYSLPLAFSSSMQQIIPLMISAIVSRLPDATIALAAFGVIRGFIFLLAGPTCATCSRLNQALVRDQRDYRVLMRFSRLIAAIMALIMLAVAYPLNVPVLGWCMGLKADLRAYIALPLASCALFPILYGAVNLWRGVFAQCHRTGVPRLGDGGQSRLPGSGLAAGHAESHPHTRYRLGHLFTAHMRILRSLVPQPPAPPASSVEKDKTKKTLPTSRAWSYNEPSR